MNIREAFADLLKIEVGDSGVVTVSVESSSQSNVNYWKHTDQPVDQAVDHAILRLLFNANKDLKDRAIERYRQSDGFTDGRRDCLNKFNLDF